MSTRIITSGNNIDLRHDKRRIIKPFVDDYSVLIDGVDESLSIPGESNFNFIQNTQTFAISFWAKFPVSGALEYVLDNAAAWLLQKGFTIRKAGDNKIYLAVNDGSGSASLNINSNAIPSGNGWNHYLLTSNLGSAAKIYINGIDDTLVSDTGTTTTGDSYFPLNIGKVNVTFGNFYIDDLAIYNRYFNPVEAAALYNGGKPTTPPTLGQQLYLTFGDDPRDDENTIYDQSPFERNATGTNLEAGDIVNDTP